MYKDPIFYGNILVCPYTVGYFQCNTIVTCLSCLVLHLGVFVMLGHVLS